MTEAPIKNVRWDNKTAIIDVVGEIDLHSSTALQQGLLGVLDRKPEHVLVNLAEVPYMDSSGVASLVKLLSRTRKVGIEVTLVALSPKVRSIFEITRLDSVFRICNTEAEATV